MTSETAVTGLGTGATTFVTDAARLGTAATTSVTVAPVPTVVAPVPTAVAPVPDVVAQGSSFDFFGCWPGALAPVPAVVAPGSSFCVFGPVEFCWPEPLVPLSPCAVDPLESGSATAIAPDTTDQQTRCEHAHTCSEAKVRQTRHLVTPSDRTARQQ